MLLFSIAHNPVICPCSNSPRSSIVHDLAYSSYFLIHPAHPPYDHRNPNTFTGPLPFLSSAFSKYIL